MLKIKPKDIKVFDTDIPYGDYKKTLDCWHTIINKKELVRYDFLPEKAFRKLRQKCEDFHKHLKLSKSFERKAFAEFLFLHALRKETFPRFWPDMA